MQLTQTGMEQDTSPHEKASNKCTIAETDALVYAWRDCFLELDSAKSPIAWRKILETVNQKGNGTKSLDQIKKKVRNLKDRYKEAKAKNK